MTGDTLHLAGEGEGGREGEKGKLKMIAYVMRKHSFLF